MGQEIVYCFKCQKRILGTEFAKGLAYQVGHHVSCSECAAGLLKTLPPQEREELLSKMVRAAQDRPSEGSGSTERPKSTHRIPIVQGPRRSPSGAGSIAIGGAFVVALILVALLLSSGSGGRKPSPETGTAPKGEPPIRPQPSSPAISPEEARQIEAARAALRKARDFARSSPANLQGQVQEWEQARKVAEGTPFLDETKRELAQLTARLKEQTDREMAESQKSGLVGWWRLDEAQGTAAADSSSNGNPGTLKSGASWTPGKSGGAVALDGVGGQVVIPHHPALNAFPITVCAWVKTSGTIGGIVNKYVSASLSGYQIYMIQGQARAWYFRTYGNCVWDGKVSDLGLNGGRINDGGWHHLAFVVDREGGRVYVDGTLKDNLGWVGTPGSTSTSQEVSIGRYPGKPGVSADLHFPGSIDDVRIYNRALSDRELHQLAKPK